MPARWLVEGATPARYAWDSRQGNGLGVADFGDQGAALTVPNVAGTGRWIRRLLGKDVAILCSSSWI